MGEGPAAWAIHNARCLGSEVIIAAVVINFDD